MSEVTASSQKIQLIPPLNMETVQISDEIREFLEKLRLFYSAYQETVIKFLEEFEKILLITLQDAENFQSSIFQLLNDLLTSIERFMSFYNRLCLMNQQESCNTSWRDFLSQQYLHVKNILFDKILECFSSNIERVSTTNTNLQQKISEAMSLIDSVRNCKFADINNMFAKYLEQGGYSPLVKESITMRFRNF